MPKGQGQAKAEQNEVILFLKFPLQKDSIYFVLAPIMPAIYQFKYASFAYLDF